MILCGDFNIDVSSAPSLTSSPSPNNLLSQLSSDFCLSQVVSEPTRITNSTASTIDLVFLSSSELLSSIKVLPPVGSSDQNSISVSLKLPSRHHATNRPSKTIWNYKKANVSLAKELLKGLPLAIESEDVDVFWNRWSTSFLSVMRCIPPKSVHLNRPIPWIDSDIRHDIRLRERLYKRFKSSKCMSNIRSSATKWSPSSERPNRSFFRT